MRLLADVSFKYCSMICYLKFRIYAMQGIHFILDQKLSLIKIPRTKCLWFPKYKLNASGFDYIQLLNVGSNMVKIIFAHFNFQ